MKLVGIMPVRNEDWVLGFTLRVALKWCDEVIVCDHWSTDGSRQIMESLGSRVVIREEREDSWDEMGMRQMLLSEARERGATHIALIDADEFLTANLLVFTGVAGYGSDIRFAVPGLVPSQMLYLPCYNVREAPNDSAFSHRLYYHSNGIWGNRWIATAFRDSPGAHWGGRRFHHREPMGVAYRQFKPMAQGEGGVIHLWGASERRLRAKHALYRITERLQFPDYTIEQIERTYSPATTVPAGGWTFASVKPEWIEPYADLMQYLHIEKEPWQIAEVKRAIEEYGYERFIGLDLLGVDKW